MFMSHNARVVAPLPVNRQLRPARRKLLCATSLDDMDKTASDRLPRKPLLEDFTFADGTDDSSPWLVPHGNAVIKLLEPSMPDEGLSVVRPSAAT
jgi:hypothetical protein